MNIGIDIGGSHVGVGLVGSSGKIINKKEVEFERKTSNCIKCKKLQKRGCILCWKEVS